MHDKPITNILNAKKQTISSIVRNRTSCPLSLLFLSVLFILVRAIRQEEGKADT